MFNLNRPIAVVLMIVIFLVLSVIAAVEYSHNEVGANRARSSALYRLGSACLVASENFFGHLFPVAPVSDIEEDKEMEAEDGNRLNNYIQVKPDENGWVLSLSNQNGEFYSLFIKNVFIRN